VAEREQETFARGTVDCIEHGSEPGIQYVDSIRFKEKSLEGMDDALGVNRLNAAGQDFDLGFAKFTFERVKLAIHVADTDIVQVHQGELSNA